MNQEDNNGANVETLRELLAELPDTAAVACREHPSTAAAVFCTGCRMPLCWACARLDADSLGFVCETCRGQQARQHMHTPLLGLLRQPFFYVAAAVVVAAVAYAHQRATTLAPAAAAAERQLAWFRRKSGRLWLRQAERAKQRFHMLARSGSDVEESRAWAGLVRQAMQRAAESWQDAPVLTDLHIGAVLTQAWAQDIEAAYRDLCRMAAEVDASQPARLSYLYHRGRLAFASNRPGAGERDWLAALQLTSQNRGTPLDKMEKMLQTLTAMQGPDRMRVMLQQQVRTLCETGLSPDTVQETILAGLRAHDVPVPADFAGEQPGPRPAPARAARAPRPQLKVRYFDEP